VTTTGAPPGKPINAHYVVLTPAKIARVNNWRWEMTTALQNNSDKTIRRMRLHTTLEDCPRDESGGRCIVVGETWGDVDVDIPAGGPWPLDLGTTFNGDLRPETADIVRQYNVEVVEARAE
jgi:hypothetical protein